MTTLRDMPMISVEQKNAFREAALKVEQERDALEALLRTVIDEAVHCGADASFDNFIENNPIASAASDYAALRDTRLENTKTHLVAITEQRDALAAHVGELVKGGRALHDELQQWALTERDPETSAAMAAWRSVVNDSPDNSSARLHSRIQELEKSGNGLYAAFEALLPGLKHIALQDYSVINEAPIRWTRAVSTTGADALTARDARMKSEALEEARSICMNIECGQLEMSYKYTETDGDGDEMVVGPGVDYGNKAMGAGHCRERIAELIAEYREQAATEAMEAIDGEDGDFANVRGVVERMIAAGYRKQAEGNDHGASS